MNEHSFFGTAIGGSLGASRKEMYDIVKYTRERVRDDRPVHLLGKHNILLIVSLLCTYYMYIAM